MSLSMIVDNRVPIKVIIIWIILVLIFYSISFWKSDATFNSSLDISLRNNSSLFTSQKLVDAIVFIAMGEMSSNPMIEYSIQSVRKLGLWTGSIYVITDSPQCFIPSNNYDRGTDFHVVTVPSASSIIEIKALKPILLDLLPSEVKGALYLDVDIVAMKSLKSFFRDLFLLLSAMPSLSGGAGLDFAAFPDAAGHFVGFCSGCEKWHTGVLFLRRGGGEDPIKNKCLSRWREILLSGKFSSDQESLDQAEREGVCPLAIPLPPAHLVFAKDYLALALSSGHSFLHVTAAGRPSDSDYFYREMVVPRLRGAMQPPLSPSILSNPKTMPNCPNTAALPVPANVTATPPPSTSIPIPIPTVS
jgi:hypothetical protein